MQPTNQPLPAVGWLIDLLILLMTTLLNPIASRGQKPRTSRRRNPTLAMAMFRGGLVETWGRVTLKMIAACRAWGLPDPLFEDKQGGVWVTFFADRYQDELLRQAGLHERQVKGVQYAKQQGHVTNSDY